MFFGVSKQTGVGLSVGFGFGPDNEWYNLHQHTKRPLRVVLDPVTRPVLGELSAAALCVDVKVSALSSAMDLARESSSVYTALTLPRHPQWNVSLRVNLFWQKQFYQGVVLIKIRFISHFKGQFPLFFSRARHGSQKSQVSR